MYDGQFCEHGEHGGLCEVEIRILRTVDPRRIFSDLDPLARSVFVLETLRNTTLYDCAVALDLPRAVAAATLVWLRAQKSSELGPTATSSRPDECGTIAAESVREVPQKKSAFRQCKGGGNEHASESRE